MSLHPWGVIFKHATEHPIFNSVVFYPDIAKKKPSAVLPTAQLIN